jgi:queuine/archaeosine tRNA-ribosyltransferase
LRFYINPLEVGRFTFPSDRGGDRDVVEVLTPSFVPVATNGALKSNDFVTASRDADCIGFVFCNSYHLLVHGGFNCINKKSNSWIFRTSR